MFHTENEEESEERKKRKFYFKILDEFSVSGPSSTFLKTSGNNYSFLELFENMTKLCE